MQLVTLQENINLPMDDFVDKTISLSKHVYPGIAHEFEFSANML